MIWHDARVFGTDPLDGMRRLQREMNRLFQGYGEAECAWPAVNLWSNRDEVVVCAEAPGVDPRDLTVTVQNDIFTIEGERKPEHLGEDAVMHRAEREFGRFSRSVRLPYDVDNSKVLARYRNGVLTVTLPRSEVSKPKQIAVATE